MHVFLRNPFVFHGWLGVNGFGKNSTESAGIHGSYTFGGDNLDLLDLDRNLLDLATFITWNTWIWWYILPKNGDRVHLCAFMRI